VTSSLRDHFRKGLRELEDARLLRTLRVLESSPGARVRLEGRNFVNFASNNYLGLAGDERLKKAARAALDRWGAGATASRLMGGTLELHDRLEAALADFKGTEAAAVFPSGYHVNTGLLPALMGLGDTVVLDRLCHASLVDGARLSRARLKVFRHNDAGDLEKILKRSAGKGRRWIVTESVFSMDGDLAPLRDIVALAKRYGAHTYIDEAHATGLWGPEGRGLVKACGLEKDVDVCMGTLSKALGTLGGFACGGKELVAWVHNRSRSFIYSTALPPACLAAALAALDICRTEPARRERLFSLGARLRDWLGGSTGEGPVVPWVVGGEEAALDAARRMWENGVFIPAVRPPTVPKGTARLRFSLTAEHTPDDVDRAAALLSGHKN
jgi:8-amino-7-oxononanoate synthase